MKFLLIIALMFSGATQASEWILIGENPHSAEIESASIELELWNYISKSVTVVFQERSTYSYQYKYLSNEHILINAVCGIEDYKYRYKRLVQVFDGGSCYFESKYDLQTKKFTDLWVNGEA